MSKISQYLLSIICTALLLSIANNLLDAKGALGAAIKLLTGLVLTSVIIAPWSDIRLDTLQSIFTDMQVHASTVVQEGNNIAQFEISALIKERTEAYILDKARSLGLDVAAEVMYDESMPQSIHTVRIVGDASPYARQRLKQTICDDLAVAEENIIWS